ncbi:MAG: signal peptide peptidase SppA, type [Bryobacterales bacterium]|nr:signal peptide peptidase SppA, type [Bryobacterales bacterium]
MGKFLLGILTGAILIVVIGVLGFFAIASLKSKPPSVAEGSTLVLRLNGEVTEQPPLELPIPFLQAKTGLTVQNVWSVLRHAATDPRIKAVVFEPEGVQLGWAKMQEIRSDIEAFRKSGKPIYAYLKAPSTREYYMATACTKIYMAPADTLGLKGLRLELTYYKNTFDKLGVQMDVEHAGKYKDYGDMYTRTSMSAETHEVLNGIADIIYADLVGAVAKGRKMDVAKARAIVDEGPFQPAQAKQNGLVDELQYEEAMFGDVRKLLGQKEIKKVSERDYVNVPDASMSAPDRIAFVVGEGAITRGSADSDGENGIESEHFIRMLAKVGEDASLKAVIVRIDSPGGEVTASDELWAAMNKLSKKKPVVISMSDAAASGGYYMAMSGDTIVSYPGTLTGSIGVVMAKPTIKGLYDKLGVTKDFVTRGKFAMLESEYQPLTPEGRAKLREGIDSNYADFVKKVADSRKKPVSVIEPLAQGRVWLGDQAKANGLVDELGGIDRAIELARKKAGIPATAKVSLALYPGKRSLLDLLFRSSGEQEARMQAEALLSGAGLDSVRTAWRDTRLKTWMRGGMMRMLPFSLEFR